MYMYLGQCPEITLHFGSCTTAQSPAQQRAAVHGLKRRKTTSGDPALGVMSVTFPCPTLMCPRAQTPSSHARATPLAQSVITKASPRLKLHFFSTLPSPSDILLCINVNCPHINPRDLRPILLVIPYCSRRASLHPYDDT